MQAVTRALLMWTNCKRYADSRFLSKQYIVSYYMMFYSCHSRTWIGELLNGMEAAGAGAPAFGGYLPATLLGIIVKSRNCSSKVMVCIGQIAESRRGERKWMDIAIEMAGRAILAHLTPFPGGSPCTIAGGLTMFCAELQQKLASHGRWQPREGRKWCQQIKRLSGQDHAATWTLLWGLLCPSM